MRQLNRVRLGIMVAVLIPLLIVAAYVVLNDSAPGSANGTNYSSFSVGSKTFELTYLATNQTQREKGLMDTRVTDTTTMLFVFPSPGYYSFWMLNVNSSLDIIWVESQAGTNHGTIVYIAADVPPCHVAVACTMYQSSSKADLVLEARGGFAMANGINTGAPIAFH